MTSQIDERQVARFTKDAVLYFLIEHRKNATIKRPDFIKAVLGNVNRRTQNEVIKQTKDILKRIHGLKVIELDENVKHYMLVNEVEYNPDVPLEWSEDQKKQQTLLLPILSLIFMNGGSIRESELWLFLQKLHLIDGSSHVSDVFGDLDKRLKSFINQRYLVYERVKLNNSEDHIFQYNWGRRAEEEVSKEGVLRHVSQVFGCEMTRFPEQYAQLNASCV